MDRAAELRRIEAIIRRFGDVYDAAAIPSEARRHLDEAGWVAGATRVLDIGGGYSPLSLVLADRGARVTVLDTFSHPYFTEHLDHRAMLEAAGTEFVEHDAVSGAALPFDDSAFDAVVSFDSLEHWHHSPKALFAELRRVVASGGQLAIGAPNAVNAKKRLEVAVGRTNWSSFDDWFEPPRFEGHVREPTVADFHRIAQSLELASWRVEGRNWLGYRHGPAERLVAGLGDWVLRFRPTLCSTIVLVGRFS